ncbi:MAG: carboxypeptidase M32 [Hyphomicrobiales bacterium]
MTGAYSLLQKRFARLSELEGALAVLHWDQATQMPPGGAPARGRQIAELSVIAHEMLISNEITDLLSQAQDDTAGLDPWQSANLAEMTRASRHARALPGDLVGRLEVAKSGCEMAWRGAREAADFSLVASDLEALFELVRESAAILGAALGLSPYDALLDCHDPGLRMAAIEPLFAALETELPELLGQAIERQKVQTTLPLAGPFPLDAQEAFGRDIMARLGFDFARGRLDVSDHPFTGGIPDDSRITTRYDVDEFTSGLMGIIHETGHALYEQGLPARWRGQPVGGARGMVMHESQSLLMEMQIGRSPQFVQFMAPLLGKAYGANGPAWDAENLARIWTRVAPGLIRVDADEITYPLHVAMRMRLEQAMINGELAIPDLPGAWNDAVHANLGLRVPDDAQGCLHDIHWYFGAVGYFPTYTLGALAAAQIAAHLRTTQPDLMAGVAQGKIQPLLEWLRANIHEVASRYQTDELMTRATGAALSADAFLAHLQARYLVD